MQSDYNKNYSPDYNKNYSHNIKEEKIKEFKLISITKEKASLFLIF